MKILTGKDKDILGGGKTRPALGKRCGAHMLHIGKMLLHEDLADNMCMYKEECCLR